MIEQTNEARQMWIVMTTNHRLAVGGYTPGWPAGVKTPAGNRPLAEAPCLPPCIHPSPRKSWRHTCFPAAERANARVGLRPPLAWGQALSVVAGGGQSSVVVERVVTSVYKSIIFLYVDLGKAFYL